MNTMMSRMLIIISEVYKVCGESFYKNYEDL